MRNIQFSPPDIREQDIESVVKTLRSALPNYEITSMIDTTSKHRKIRLTTVNDNLLGKI